MQMDAITSSFLLWHISALQPLMMQSSSVEQVPLVEVPWWVGFSASEQSSGQLCQFSCASHIPSPQSTQYLREIGHASPGRQSATKSKPGQQL
jgi:hypothetical protein